MVFLRNLFIVLCMFCSNFLFGQTQLDGKVKNTDGEPISQVSIQIKTTETEEVLSFGFSDFDGNFKLQFNSDESEVIVRLAYLGFHTITDTIENKSQSIVYQMSPSAEELKPVKIESLRIKEEGDTISYRVKSFAKEEDRSIADVLKNMPGITISEFGQISFQGTPINKFYIEGLDMLGGKYNLASENLPHKEVDEVEILKNHQPIKILEGKKSTNEPAINLKLKNAYTFTGNIELGGGFQPGLWHANITPMLFSPKRQFLASIQSNNIGESLQQSLRNLTGETTLVTVSENQPPRQWLSVIRAIPGQIPQKRYLDNQDFIITPNHLEKLSKDYQLRTNISYGYSRTKEQGQTNSLIFVPTDTIPLFETIENKNYNRQLGVTLSLSKNTEKRYFNNRLKLNGSWNSADGSIMNQEERVSERLSNKVYGISNLFETAIPIGKQLLSLSSSTSFDYSPQALAVKPGFFEEVFNNNNPYDKIEQEVGIKAFKTHNAVSFIRSFGLFTLQTELGLTLDWKNFETRLFADNSLLSAPQFQNDLNRFHSNINLLTAFSYDLRNWNLSMGLPIAFETYSLRNKTEKQDLYPFVFNPSLIVSRGIFKNTYAEIGLGHYTSYGDFDQMFSGLVLTNYRMMQSYDSPFPKSSETVGRLRINYRNTRKILFWHLNYSMGRNKQNLIFSSEILPDGSRQLKAERQDNFYTNHTLKGEISTLIGWLDAGFKITPEFSWRKSDMIINGVNTPLKGQSQSVKVELNKKWAFWFTTDYQGVFSFHQNKSGSFSRQTNANNQQKLNLKFLPAKNHYLSLSTELTHFQLIEKSKNMIFSDVIYRYTLKSVDFELSYTNIFNNYFYPSSNLSSFQYTESFYQLRPWEILLKVKFSI